MVSLSIGDLPIWELLRASLCCWNWKALIEDGINQSKYSTFAEALIATDSAEALLCLCGPKSHRLQQISRYTDPMRRETAAAFN